MSNINKYHTIDSILTDNLTLLDDINTNTSNLIKYDINNNVGIGTTNPQGKLHISSGPGSNGDCKLILQADSDNSNENSTPYIELWADGSIPEGAIFLDNNELVIANGASNSGLDFRSTGSGDYTNATSKMFITSGGNVGIGTTNPERLLHIKQNDTETENAGLLIEQDGSGDAKMSFLLTFTRAWSCGIDNSDSDKFKISSSSALDSQTKLTIDTNDNIGIAGVSDPTINLAIGDNDTGLNQEGDGQLSIYANNQEKVRINTTGLAIGTTTLRSPFNCIGDMTTDSNTFLGLNVFYDGNWKAAYNTNRRVAAVKHEHGSQNSIQFRTGASSYDAGDTISWQPIPYVSNGTFTNASDDRLKTNEKFITNATETIMKLRPETYTVHSITEDENSNVSVNYNDPLYKESGLIAQEIYYLNPELRHILSIPEEANPEPDVIIPDDPKTDIDYEAKGWSKKMSGVKYTQLIPYIIKMNQEQQEIINDLKNRIEILEQN